MEDYDELSKGPNEQGQLILHHDSWKQLPPEILNFTHRLISLNISYNQMQEISDIFGSLYLLEELNASHNQITRIDPIIGKCIRLMHLDVSHNQLTSLPNELSKCLMLKRLDCHDNQIISIPPTLEKHPALHTLDLQRNKLDGLPSGLALIPTLKEIRCAENPQLGSIPPGILQQKASLSLWCLQLHHKHDTQILEQSNVYTRLENRLQETEQCRLRLLEEEEDLQQQVDSLHHQRPLRYLALKDKTIATVNQITDRLKQKLSKRSK